MYVPICLSPSFAGIVVSSTGCPSTTNFAGFVALIVSGTVFSTGFSSVPIFPLPGVKVTVPSWGDPCIPSELASVPSGVTSTTLGE